MPNQALVVRIIYYCNPETQISFKVQNQSVESNICIKRQMVFIFY